MMTLIERFFHVRKSGSTVHTELIGGTTTFFTLSYIIFVQPAILSATGMDFGAVMSVTCITSALTTILMGVLTNYPIALAPAMAHNVFFAFTVSGAIAAGGLGYSWQAARLLTVSDCNENIKRTFNRSNDGSNRTEGNDQ